MLVRILFISLSLKFLLTFSKSLGESLKAIEEERKCIGLKEGPNYSEAPTVDGLISLLRRQTNPNPTLDVLEKINFKFIVKFFRDVNGNHIVFN